MTDNDPIFLRCQRGDHEAFAALIEQHIDAVRFFIARRCPRWSVVEDVTQETFVRVWSHCRTRQGTSSVRTWIIGIAHNVLRETLRSEDQATRQSDVLLSMPAPNMTPDDEEDFLHQQRARQHALHTCLEKLPPRAKKLLERRHADNTPLKQLAQAYKKNDR